ncbi:MAG: hypothetical protein JKY65_32775 [Planctomycetes bacterium]|nr:hypothetical protein [Planctomycetota bacterium]
MPKPILLACSALLFALAGCITVPDEIKADMQQPDGTRPNNFGRAVEVSSWEGRDDERGATPGARPFKVVPDHPTIARASSAPLTSATAPEGSK